MSSLKRFFNSFLFASRGVVQVVLSERNMKVHLIAALLVSAAGIYFRITAAEWCIVALCIGGVLAAEVLNTAIESLTDLVEPGFHPQVRSIKDAAAGAVLLAAIAATVCGLVIFWKYFFPAG